jgi:hypothetical protein
MIANNTLRVPRIESRVQVIRGLRVMLDVDLAALYGVQTKRLNEQIKRNRDRFPSDFLFQLTADEKTEVVANCDHLQNLKFSKTLPLRLPSTEQFRQHERPTKDINTPASHANGNQHESCGGVFRRVPNCGNCVDTVSTIELEQKLHTTLLEARERLARRGILLGALDNA